MQLRRRVAGRDEREEWDRKTSRMVCTMKRGETGGVGVETAWYEWPALPLEATVTSRAVLPLTSGELTLPLPVVALSELTLVVWKSCPAEQLGYHSGPDPGLTPTPSAGVCEGARPADPKLQDTGQQQNIEGVPVRIQY